MAETVIRVAELRLEWDRALLVLDMMATVALLAFGLLYRCFGLGGGLVRRLCVHVDDRLEVRRWSLRACSVSCPTASRKRDAALFHSFVQPTDSFDVASCVVSAYGLRI